MQPQSIEEAMWSRRAFFYYTSDFAVGDFCRPKERPITQFDLWFCSRSDFATGEEPLFNQGAAALLPRSCQSHESTLEVEAFVAHLILGRHSSGGCGATIHPV